MTNSDSFFNMAVSILIASTLFACGYNGDRTVSCASGERLANGVCPSEEKVAASQIQLEDAQSQTQGVSITSVNLPKCVEQGLGKEGDFMLHYQENDQISGQGWMTLIYGKGFSCVNGSTASLDPEGIFPNCSNACPNDSQVDDNWGWCESVASYSCQIR